MTVTKRTRYEVLRRDQHTCRYCHATDAKLTIDHVTPTSLGGDDTPNNLVACCTDCNSGKSSSTPDATLVQDIDDKAVVWAKARAKVIEDMRSQRHANRQARAPFLTAWRHWDPDCRHLPAGWTESFDLWIAQGADPDWTVEALDIAVARKHLTRASIFRYTAGVMWNWVKEIDERTAELLPDDEPTCLICEHIIDEDTPWAKTGVHLRCDEEISRARYMGFTAMRYHHELDYDIDYARRKSETQEVLASGGTADCLICEHPLPPQELGPYEQWAPTHDRCHERLIEAHEIGQNDAFQLATGGK